MSRALSVLHLRLAGGNALSGLDLQHPHLEPITLPRLRWDHADHPQARFPSGDDVTRLPVGTLELEHAERVVVDRHDHEVKHDRIISRAGRDGGATRATLTRANSVAPAALLSEPA